MKKTIIADANRPKMIPKTVVSSNPNSSITYFSKRSHTFLIIPKEKPKNIPATYTQPGNEGIPPKTTTGSVKNFIISSNKSFTLF